MFVMECLDHFLDNSCKAGVVDMQSGGGRVYTEVTKMNMQRCIICTKKSQKGAKSLDTG